MSNKPNSNQIKSLSDLAVRYDMAELIEKARAEFDSVITNRELLDQDFIANVFNQEGMDHEGN